MLVIWLDQTLDITDVLSTSTRKLSTWNTNSLYKVLPSKHFIQLPARLKNSFIPTKFTLDIYRVLTGFLQGAYFSVAPSIHVLEPSNKIVVREGSTVELECQARGHPPPHVTWYREVSRY